MLTLAQNFYLDSDFDIDRELPRAGSALENPYVYDASAREIKDLARRGLVEIVGEQAHMADGWALIDRLVFRRVR